MTCYAGPGQACRATGSVSRTPDYSEDSLERYTNWCSFVVVTPSKHQPPAAPLPQHCLGPSATTSQHFQLAIPQKARDDLVPRGTLRFVPCDNGGAPTAIRKARFPTAGHGAVTSITKHKAACRSHLDTAADRPRQHYWSQRPKHSQLSPTQGKQLKGKTMRRAPNCRQNETLPCVHGARHRRHDTKDFARE